MKRIVKSKCKNNKWEDFGNHTGFKWVGKVCNNLTVGEWYEFEFDDDENFGYYQLIGQDETGMGVNGYDIGTQFSGNNKSFDCYRFEHFFLSISEIREMKLNEIIK